MEQVEIQAPTTRTLLENSVSFYQDLLAYLPEQTHLQEIPENRWNEFATQRGLNANSLGVYLPRNQIAFVVGNNSLSLFHEYFGHGLYCEQNLIGRRLVELEKKLLEEEKQEFNSIKFNLNDLQGFRKQNKTFQELENFEQENLGRYELFAIWTEYLLSRENGLMKDFEKKYDYLSEKEKKAVDSVISFSENYGDLATMYSQGMARRTTPERVKRLLEDIYKDKLKDVKFALLYGSKKDFSDIDVFIVGGEVPRLKDNWIDVVSYSLDDFEEKRSLFDVEITDALFSGEFVFGNKGYLLEQKQKLFEQPITEKTIKYNLDEAKKQEKFAYSFSEDSEWRQISLSYALTSRLMSDNLKQGKKFFTRSGLISYSRREKQIRLKGGIENNAT
jgi:hypothetical protein